MINSQLWTMGKKIGEVIDSTFAYLFPCSWSQPNRSHNHKSLSNFVSDFLHLRKAELAAADEDELVKSKLVDDTMFSRLHHQTAFELAIQTGNGQVLRQLLGFPTVDLNDLNHSYTIKKPESSYSFALPPLCAAAANGFIDVVRLLAEDPRLDSLNCGNHGDSRTPLSWAAGNGHEAVVQFLLGTSQAEINAEDAYGLTPLHHATLEKHEAVVQLLLATFEIKLNMKDFYGRTPLLCAAGKGYEALVRALLVTGKAEVNSFDEFGETPVGMCS